MNNNIKGLIAELIKYKLEKIDDIDLANLKRLENDPERWLEEVLISTGGLELMKKLEAAGVALGINGHPDTEEIDKELLASMQKALSEGMKNNKFDQQLFEEINRLKAIQEGKSNG